MASHGHTKSYIIPIPVSLKLGFKRGLLLIGLIHPPVKYQVLASSVTVSTVIRTRNCF